MDRRTQPQLKLHAPRELVAPGESHIIMLNPFWGPAVRDVTDRSDFAERYEEIGKELFELTDRESADVSVFPVEWKRVRDDPQRVERARAFAREAQPKPAVVFYTGDAEDPVPIEDVTVFRTSMTRTDRRPHEFALPGFHEDLLKRVGGEVPVRQKSGKPVVSFCGFVFYEDEAATRREALRRKASEVKRIANEKRGRPSIRDVYVRSRAIEALLHQRRYVDPELTLRAQGGGGGWTTYLSSATRPVEEARREYLHSMVNSDYVLCTRGIGNWSYRLYETLCLGRIPVFVDTDCVLPYDFLLPWRDYVVWVTRPEVERIGEKVAEFHDGLSADDFVELQHACRRLWVDYLSPEGFFSHFHRHFSLA